MGNQIRGFTIAYNVILAIFVKMNGLLFFCAQTVVNESLCVINDTTSLCGRSDETKVSVLMIRAFGFLQTAVF